LRYLDLPFSEIPGLLSYALPLFFYGPLRRYASGSKLGLIDQLKQEVLKKRDEDQFYIDAKDIGGELPNSLMERFINWWNTDYISYDDKQPRRLAYAAGASIIMVMLLKAVAGLLVTPFARQQIYTAHLLRLDTFLSTWPATKIQAPLFLHERFDDLYDNKFDIKTGRLRMTNEERAIILRRITLDIKAFYAGQLPAKEIKKEGAPV